MVTVSYRDTGKKRKLKVEGHAGSGPAGHDLICCSASTLVITLESALESARIKHTSGINEGLAEIRCRDPKARTIFDTVMCGFYTLAMMYPGYIRIVTE
jgi:uncharacterized protein YsxB (DUF464 family)